MGPEELSGDHKRLIEWTLRQWEPEGAWPQRMQAVVWMRREAMDHKSILAQLPHEYLFTQGQELGLTLYGVAAAQSGAEWVEPFVSLVRLGVERFQKDPHGIANVTDADLQALTPGWSGARRDRAHELYQSYLLDLGGSGSRSRSAWKVDVSMRCLKYRGLETVWDFKQRHDWKALDPAQADQRRMALWIYERWREDGRTPTALQVVLHHQDMADPLGVLHSLSGTFLSRANFSDTEGLGALGVRDLLVLRPDSNGDLEGMARLLSAVCELYSRGEGPPSIAEIASRAGVTEAVATRLLESAQTLPKAGLMVDRGASGAKLVVWGESIFELENVRTADDIARIISDEREKLRRAREELEAKMLGVEGADTEPQQFPGLDIHPRIAEIAWPLFADGHYREAVFKAALALNTLVQERSGVSDKDNVGLMWEVFSKKDPVLAFNALADPSDKDEQEGFMHLFAGAMMALRNPRAHRLGVDEEGAAREYILLLSLLAKLADRAQRRS